MSTSTLTAKEWEKLMSLTPSARKRAAKLKGVVLPPKKKKKAKRLEIEAAAIARGTELGKQQAHKRKNLTESLKEHIGRMIDNTSILDVAAVGAGTVLIHGLIIASPELKQQAAAWIPTAIFGLMGSVLSYGLSQLEELGYFGKPEPLKDDWPYWVMAFFISFILVKQGAQIAGIGSSALTSIIATFMA